MGMIKSVQVHFTIVEQFYVNVNVELFIHVFVHLYDGENRYGKIFL